MNRLYIRRLAWLLVVGVSFAAGFGIGIRRSPSTATSAGTARVVPSAPAPPTPNGPEKRPAPAAVPGDDPVAWVGQFKNRDGKIDPDRMAIAIKDAVRESDPVKSMMHFAQLIRELTAENAPAALQSLRESVSGFESMRYLPMLTYAWGSISGEKALAAMKDVGGRDAMFASAATLAGWASTNAPAARKWLEENGSPDTRWLLNRALVTGMARDNLDGATAYISGLDERERQSLVEVLAEQKLKSGFDDASRWALGLTDPAMKRSAFERVASQFAGPDPARAATWVKSFASEPFAREAVGTVAREYAQKDPGATLAWAGELPPGDGRNEAYERLFREWGRSDPTLASESLNSLAPGPAKDHAIESFTRSIARENPEDAITWAASISDPQARENAQIEIVQRWRGTNAEAAAEWAAANLAEDARQKASQSPRMDWRGGRSAIGDALQFFRGN